MAEVIAEAIQMIHKEALVYLMYGRMLMSQLYTKENN